MWARPALPIPLDTIAALVGDTTSIEALNRRTKGALAAAQQLLKSPVALGAIMDALLGDTQTMLTVDRDDTAAVEAMATVAALLGATEELTQLLQHFPLKPKQLTAAWHWVAQVGHVPILEKLQRYGVALMVTDEYGETAVHEASRGNQPTVLQWLQKHGVALDPRSNSGNTPLYVAAENNTVDCVKVPLAHGADPTVSDNSGNTPLRLARDRDYSAVVALLEAAIGKNQSFPPVFPAPFSVMVPPPPLWTTLIATATKA